MCLGVGINLRPLGKREVSPLDKWRLGKLITLGLTNLPAHLPSNTVAALDGFYKEGWLCVSSKVTYQSLKIHSNNCLDHQMSFLTLPN